MYIWEKVLGNFFSVTAFLPQVRRFSFLKAKMDSKYFTIDSPKLGNQYLEDNVIRDILNRYVPKEIVSEIEPDLIRFGDR